MKSLAPRFHLNDYCLVSVKGDGASKFLQGQITINVELIKPDQAALAAICNAKGRVISLFHVFRIDQDFFLLLPKSIAQLTIDYLKIYSVFYKVIMAEDSEQITVTETANQGTSKDSQPQAQKRLEENQSQVDLISIQHTSFCLVLGLQQTSINKTNQEDDKQFLWYWQLADNKICWLSAESSGQFLPHNLNLPSLKAVDFNKGCFTGQEIIARMQYKGKLKQQLALLQTQSNPSAENNRQTIELSQSKTLFQQGKKVGEVVCHAHHPQQGDRFISLLKKPLNSLENFMLDAENPPILNLKE
ncbi:MAG: hypothetical protein Q9M92_03280 [Enterobacterales bacterium]|nr:hypothetical protein [Enterobacterales bacterium]